MIKWKANGWRRREGSQFKEVKNEDLWRRLDELAASHQITFEHVAGHNGIRKTERCDELAVAAYQQYLRTLLNILDAPAAGRAEARAPEYHKRRWPQRGGRLPIFLLRTIPGLSTQTTP